MEHSSVSNHEESRPRGIVERVKQQAAAQFSTQKDRATDGLGSVAAAIRQTGQPLRDNDQTMLADYAATAADQLERFSSRLRERDAESLMRDVKRFAQRQPAIFIGAAFAVGVIAARFFKSSGDGLPERAYGAHAGVAPYSGGR